MATGSPSAATATSGLLPGFADTVHGAQVAFRGLMTALSEPGRVVEIGRDLIAPAGASPAAIATLLTLADFETPLWLAPGCAEGAVATHMRFHTGAPIVPDAERAMLVLTDAASAVDLLGAVDTGTDQFPDRSATMIIEVPQLTGGRRVTLSGPGIERSVDIAPAGLGPEFWMAVASNHALYPRGVDMILTCGSDAIGLPRSTRAVTADGLGG